MMQVEAAQKKTEGQDNAEDLLKGLPRYPMVTTMFTFLVETVARYSRNDAFVYRAGSEEHRVSYSKLFEDVLLLSRAFRKRGVESGDKVMLLSDNRYAWIVTDLALMSIGAVSVPRGSDTPTQELQYIIEHSEAAYLVVESDTLLDRHHDYLSDCKQIRAIYVMTGRIRHTLFSNIYAYVDLLDDRTYRRSDVEKFVERGEKLKPEDLLTIIYTSGTTGLPKGVMLTHGNVMHNVRVLPGIIQLQESDRWLSILPSWHIFERTTEYVALAGGTSIVYSTLKTFAQDLEHYQPTLVATVPRVWESLYNRVQQAVRKKGAFASHLFQGMVWISAHYRKNRRQLLGRLPLFTQHGFFGRLMQQVVAMIKMAVLAPLYVLARKKLSVVQQRFGGRLRLAISGGGTLAPYLEKWIDGVGIRIVNAYGMTECSPAIAGRGLTCRTFGTLGPAVPETELRIVSETGEVLPIGAEGLIEVKGPQVTPGYFRNDEENSKAFTPDGFFRTGDLGKLAIGRELVITGRAKEIIVLSSGENVDPIKIENVLTMFPFIQDAVLVGQDKKGLGALLVPNIEELKTHLSEKMKDFRKEGEDWLSDSKVLDSIRNDLNRLLRPKEGFKPYEKLQGVIFLDKEFKLGEELTNTLKKKRHFIEQKYRKIINELLA